MCFAGFFVRQYMFMSNRVYLCMHKNNDSQQQLCIQCETRRQHNSMHVIESLMFNYASVDIDISLTVP